MENENNAGNPVETVEELKAKLAKAENKIVEMKKTTKEAPEPTTNVEPEEKETSEETTDERINELVKAWIESYKAEQTATQNQTTTNNASISGTPVTASTGFKAVSPTDFDKMGEETRTSYMKESMAANWDSVVFL